MIITIIMIMFRRVAKAKMVEEVEHPMPIKYLRQQNPKYSLWQSKPNSCLLCGRAVSNQQENREKARIWCL